MIQLKPAKKVKLLSITPKVNERSLLKKVIDRKLSNQEVSSIYKSNLELLVWHEFLRNEHEIKKNFKGKSAYSSYCLAVFIRILKTYTHKSEFKAV